MDFYSIGGIDITLEQLPQLGGYREGELGNCRISNCEWSADLDLRQHWEMPHCSLLEVTPRFRHGNREKFESDLCVIQPLIRLALAPSGTRLRMHGTQ